MNPLLNVPEPDPSILLYVKGWACRWWHEPGWRASKVQIVIFLRGEAQLNFTMGVSWIRQLAKDLNETDTNGDDYHYIHTDPGQPSFVFSRGRALEFRKALVRLLDLGPKNTPFQGFASDDIALAKSALVSVETKQESRWV